MGFALSKLWVEVGGKTNAFDKAIDGVHGKLTKTSVALGTFAGNVASSLAKFGKEFAGEAFSKTIVAASNLSEALSKTDVVFGESAGKVKSQANDMAKSFGLPKQAMLDAASGIGLILEAAGQSEGEAAKLSNSFAKLAADATSLYNVPLEDSLQKIKSALVGESEPIKALGVLMNEAAVQGEAMRLGLSKTGKDLDEQTKVMARASLITSGLAKAQGDLERTQGSASNQFRKFSGGIENIGVSIGEYFLPAVTVAVNKLNTWVSAIADMGSVVAPAFDAVGSAASDVFDSLYATGEGVLEIFGRFPEAWDQVVGPGPVNAIMNVAGVVKGEFLNAFDLIGVAMRNVPTLWDIVVLKITEGVINIGEQMGAFAQNAAILGNYIANNWSALVVDGINLVSTAFENLGSNLYRLAESIIDFLNDPTAGFNFEWTPLLKGFEATAEKLPEMIKPALTSMQDQIDEKIGQMGEKEAQRAIERNKKVVEAATVTPAGKTVTAAGKKEKEFKSESLDAAEFARKLQASITAKDDDTPKQQLDSLKGIETACVDMSKYLKKPTVAKLG